MSSRKNISSGVVWEDIHGYSRAVRVGDVVYVSGTVASGDDGEIVGPGDMYLQAAYAIKKIERALKLAGANLNNVVRTRLYVTDIQRWEEAARAHSEAFNRIRPASTMVEISRLINEEYLVEIEVEAIVGA